MRRAFGLRAVTLSLGGSARACWRIGLRGRPTRANFRTGSLTMCTLVPMRSVPHRVVCLIGLDDGAFPRQPAVDGDNILLRDPMTGERDERSEDRQLLLDAVLAARERLVITYSGADERTNAPRPPAVPVGELLDTLEAAYRQQRRRARCAASWSPTTRCSRSTRRTSAAGALGCPRALQLRPDRAGRCAGDGGARATRPGPTWRRRCHRCPSGIWRSTRCGRSSSIRCAGSCASAWA